MWRCLRELTSSDPSTGITSRQEPLASGTISPSMWSGHKTLTTRSRAPREPWQPPEVGAASQMVFTTTSSNRHHETTASLERSGPANSGSMHLQQLSDAKGVNLPGPGEMSPRPCLAQQSRNARIPRVVTWPLTQRSRRNGRPNVAQAGPSSRLDVLVRPDPRTAPRQLARLRAPRRLLADADNQRTGNAKRRFPDLSGNRL